MMRLPFLFVLMLGVSVDGRELYQLDFNTTYNDTNITNPYPQPYPSPYPQPDPNITIVPVGFSPYTFNWSSIFTSYPQSQAFSQSFLTNDFACIAPYALCSYANCTVLQNTNPLIAECGCVAYTQVDEWSLGTTAYTLDLETRTADDELCGRSFSSFKSPCVWIPNVSTFCGGMERNTSSGKAYMYGGQFDLVSTWNPFTWPKNTSENQGAEGKPKLCTNGYVANCFSAPCLVQTSWNGLNATCYCPVYNATNFVMSSDKAGYECSGQYVNGTLTYVQNGV
jgi:hypothetical protein